MPAPSGRLARVFTIVTAAIFGFIGVLVGGVLNALAGKWLDDRKIRAGVRVGGRIAWEELQAALAALERSMGNSSWEPLRGFGPDLPAWVEHRSAIAAGLDFEDWLVLRRGYGALADVQRESQEAVSSFGGLGSEEIDRLRSTRDELLEASELLDTYAD